MQERSDFRDVTAALYAVVSAPAGKRDWEGIRHWYHPDARLVRTGINEDGGSFARVMSFDDYVENAETLLADVRFNEVETSHEVRFFGNVAQLASGYEFSWDSPAESRQGRGVNFFTIVFDGSDWKIMSIVWDNER